MPPCLPARRRRLASCLLLSLACAAGLAGSLAAAVTCPPVFGSHMVLQRELPVPVWGTAAPGERVAVEFAGQVIETVAALDGRWQVKLAPLATSPEPRTLVVRAGNELRFDDVLVGEVWLCSGQSNMEKPLGVRRGQQPTDNAEAEIRDANHPLLRLFQMPHHGRPAKDDLTLQWFPCQSDTVNQMSFSAAAYFFGRELRTQVGVPVGLIHTSYGGTRIELWTPPTGYADQPGLGAYAGAAAGDRQIDGTRIGGLYHTMVEPLVPYALRGFLWYQGESNLMFGEAGLYTAKMNALITAWRAAWDRPDAPFYFVQLAPFRYSDRHQSRPLSREALPQFWEAQTAALQVPHTGMAVITDTVAKLADIHPTNKRDVGLRLARLALARTYGKADVVDSGPVFRDFKVRDTEVELTFEHAAGLASRDGQPLAGFTIAGDDRVFVPATATVMDGKVVVSASTVKCPVAVRLGWSESANPNLVNVAGLPARVFRTDNWPASLFRAATAEDAPATRLPEVAGVAIPELTVRLTDFGGVGDGRTLNTAAFAAAIDAVAARGGGRVVVAAGEWLTGPIVLRSKLALQLERGARLRFSENRADYPLVETNFEGRAEWRCQAPLSGVDLEDVAITGEGSIDGSGQVWRPVKRSKQTPEQWAALLATGGVVNAAGDIWYPSEGARLGNETGTPRLTADPARRAAIKDALRPVLLSLRNCRRVLLEGVTFENSPAWCLHPLLCEDLTVRGITVRNPWYAQNGDGLDLDSCRNVLVEQSTFDVGDDAICLKSGRDAAGRDRGKPTENVTVRGCTVRHGHGGFVIGSEMSGGVRNVRVSDCSFSGTDVGLRFKSTRGRGGVVEGILVERVRMEQIARDAIVFDLFYGGQAPTDPDSASGEQPVAASSAHVPGVSETTPAFRNIVLRDISCSGAARAGLLQGLPEMPLENLRLENCTLTAGRGLVLSDVDGITLERMTITPREGPALELRGARHAHVPELRSPGTPNPLVRISGARSSAIDLPASLPEAAVHRAAEVPASAVRRD